MKDHITLKIKPKEIQTDIYIGTDLIKAPYFLALCQTLARRFALITDDYVGKFYAKPLIDLLKEKGFDVTFHTFKAGEKSKSRRVKETIEDALFKAGHGRDSAIIAMGGGVTLDIGGFVAATFCRGVPFFSIPTSLLAMADASIGSKTGVNVSFGKNLIGSIYPPYAIFMDLSFLNTLSKERMREGAAEIIKHGIIAHSHLFEMLADDLDKWNERDMLFLKKLIYESCLVKRKIVETDMKEEGMRRILNFGHTIGHAVEQLENYRMPHGEAVAIGMVVESLISLKMRKINEEEFDAIYRLLKAMRFSLSISDQVTSKALLEAMCYDKKAHRRTPRFVILNGMGKVQSYKGTYCTEVDNSLLSEALGWMVAAFHQG